ncbi:MAG TPA: hypothetical protein VNQ33_02475 [Acidimicrobiales bacterium]|nr:hypothetical protein [Acidimicrobiales bacterium]
MPATSPATRQPRARRALAGLAVALTVLGAGACSSPAPSQRELTEALVDSGLSKKVADCAASALTDSLTKSELAELTERGAGGAPVDDPAKDDDSYDKLQKAMSACREIQAQAAPTTTVAPAAEAGSSTTVTIADGTEGAELNPASTTTTP